MMLSDEPYRWAEAVANRREYIEDQLRQGSPLVAVGYEEGVLLVTLGQGQQKIFEVYDRVALAAIGHSTDIEKLRQAAIDMAHTIGFNYSEADVTLRQIVHFGLGPAMKAGFDEIVRSPYLARMLLVELDGIEGERTFYTVDYDGAFQKHEEWGAVGGVPEADGVMQRHLMDLKGADLSLQAALEAALLAWAAGRWVGQLEDIPSEPDELDRLVNEADFKDVLQAELKALTVEAVVLQKSRQSRNKYRTLTQAEIAPALAAYQE